MNHERENILNMIYRILGDSDCPMLEVSLERGETIVMERGSMVYMQDVTLEGKMNSKGSGFGALLGAIGRSMTSGESMFITHATGESNDGRVGIAPAIPGKIQHLYVDGYTQYRLNTGAFLCCDSTVTYNMKSQSAGKAFFGGTGGFFVMETAGEGDLFVSAFGDLIELEVTPDRPLTIDNEHVVAWDASLQYSIEIASGTFGFTSGEGLVNRFTGNGKVLIQTRNIHALADALRPYLPTSSSN